MICLLVLFYIKNRNQTTTCHTLYKRWRTLFYIKNRNQTTTDTTQNPANDHYFTSKIEIKPQRAHIRFHIRLNYFTSKIEIKPQLFVLELSILIIILHQKQKSNHNSVHFHQLKTSHNINSRSHYFLKRKFLILYNYLL